MSVALVGFLVFADLLGELIFLPVELIAFGLRQEPVVLKKESVLLALDFLYPFADLIGLMGGNFTIGHGILELLLKPLLTLVDFVQQQVAGWLKLQ